MVTEAAPAPAEATEAVVAEASTAGVSIPSSATQELVSTEEQTSGSEEGEGAAQEQEEQADRTPAELGAAIAGKDLIDAVADGDITKDEAKRYTSYRQSLQDKGQKVQARLEITGRAVAEASNAFWTVYSDPSTAGLTDAMRAEILGPKWQALAQAVGQQALAQAHAEFVAAIAQLSGGEELAAKAEASDRPFLQLVQEFVPLLQEHALTQQETRPGHVSMTTAAYNKDIAEARKAGANAARPAVAGNTSDGANHGNASRADIDYAGYLKLTEPEKQQFNQENPDKFREFLGIRA